MSRDFYSGIEAQRSRGAAGFDYCIGRTVVGSEALVSYAYQNIAPPLQGPVRAHRSAGSEPRLFMPVLHLGSLHKSHVRLAGEALNAAVATNPELTQPKPVEYNGILPHRGRLTLRLSSGDAVTSDAHILAPAMYGIASTNALAMPVSTTGASILRLEKGADVYGAVAPFIDKFGDGKIGKLELSGVELIPFPKKQR